MIRNASTLIKGSSTTQKARRITINLLNTALVAVDPRLLVKNALKMKKGSIQIGTYSFNLDKVSGVFVVGAGKATGRMAEATEELLKDYITDGLIIVPEKTVNEYSLDVIQVQEGGHPVPTQSSIDATKQLLEMISNSPTASLTLTLFSGGGSALLTLPSPGITLKNLQHTNELLLRSGMSIHKVNTVRKHLSQVKGGLLANHIHPRRHIGLLLSDIPSEQLDMIASGPTLPDPSRFSDVYNLLEEQKLWNQLPTSVQHHISAGVQKKITETPKPNNPIFGQSIHLLIGSNQDACNAVQELAKREKFGTRILTTNCQGEARVVGDQLGQLARQIISHPQPQVVIVGSETTVTVHHEGLGGRNTELVTAALPHLQGVKGLVIASLATDGIDGPTDAAGAIADGDSYHRAQTLGQSPTTSLEAHSTYDFFQALDDLLITGPTNTNVRDITLILWTGTS